MTRSKIECWQEKNWWLIDVKNCRYNVVEHVAEETKVTKVLVMTEIHQVLVDTINRSFEAGKQNFQFFSPSILHRTDLMVQPQPPDGYLGR